MPRRIPYLLRWTTESQAYEVYVDGFPISRQIIPDSLAWFNWLDEIASFSFRSRLDEYYTVRKEIMRRGGAYWYGYRRVQQKVVKRYIGKTADL